MIRSLFSISITCFLFIFPCLHASASEENFFLINGVTDDVVLELGPGIHRSRSPCSTFKIALSLMGYDSEILKDEKTPTWPYKEGYDDFLASWKDPQTPESWMKNSCIWFSKVLASELESEKIHNYLVLLEYGNQDISGGLTKFWVNSSLKISPQGQVNFLQKMIQKKLPISTHAVEMTKTLLFKEELPEGWRLFGKTGWSGSVRQQDEESLETGWFVGWIEKDHMFFPFAYNIRERKIALDQRIPRVKQLLQESNVMTPRL